MSPEIRNQYKADMARCRAERDAYRSRAAYQWKLRIDLNRSRRWLEANEALDRHHEYKKTAAFYDAEVRRIKGVLS